MSRGLSAGLACVIGLVLAGAGSARAGWVETAELHRPEHAQTGAPHVATNAHGEAVVTWTVDRVLWASRRSADGRWSAAEQLPTAEVIRHQVAIDAQGRVLVVWDRLVDGRLEIRGLAADPGGEWRGAAVRRGGLSAMAMSDAGEALLLWLTRKSVNVSVRTPDGRWTATTRARLPRGAGSYMEHLDVGAGGDAVACFTVERNRPRVWGMYRRAGGEVGRAHPLSRAGRLNTRCAIDDGGRATVVWATDEDSNFDAAPDELIVISGGIEAVTRSPLGNWTKPVRLAGSDSVAAELAVAPNGHRLVTWPRRGRWEARERAPGGKWRRLSAPWRNASHPFLVGAPDGTMHAVWEDRETLRTLGATHRPGGGWTTPEAPGAERFETSYTVAAFDAGGLLVAQTPLSPPHRVRTLRYTPGG